LQEVTIDDETATSSSSWSLSWKKLVTAWLAATVGGGGDRDIFGGPTAATMHRRRSLAEEVVRPTVTSASSSFACPLAIGSVEEIVLATSGILSLDKTMIDNARLCTLTRRVLLDDDAKNDDDSSGDVTEWPVAVSYDGHDWERAGGTYAATLPEWTCDNDSCRAHLPAGTYRLVHRPGPVPSTTTSDAAAVVRFLEMASFGARPTDLNAAGTFVPATYVHEHMHTVPATYHREFYRRRANPHWQFHKPEFAANLDPCRPYRDGITSWRRNVISVKDAFRIMHVKPWENHWEVSIELEKGGVASAQVRTVVPRLRLLRDEEQMEGAYEICAGLSDIRRGLYWVMVRGVCREIISTDLYVHFPDNYRPANVLTGTLPSLTDSSAWQPSSKFLPHYLLKSPLAESSCASLLPFNAFGPPVYAQTASGEWLQFDPRIVMEENTVTAPLPDGGAASWSANRTLECSNVKRNFINEATCVMATADRPACRAGSSTRKDRAVVEGSVIVCGSPGEVANDPTLGDHWLDIPSISTPALSKFLKVPRDTTGSEMLSKQKGFVWSTIAVTSPDQLVRRSRRHAFHHAPAFFIVHCCFFCTETTCRLGIVANLCSARRRDRVGPDRHGNVFELLRVRVFSCFVDSCLRIHNIILTKTCFVSVFLFVTHSEITASKSRNNDLI
jgi:hypothetical protein